MADGPGGARARHRRRRVSRALEPDAEVDPHELLGDLGDVARPRLLGQAVPARHGADVRHALLDPQRRSLAGGRLGRVLQRRRAVGRRARGSRACRREDGRHRHCVWDVVGAPPVVAHRHVAPLRTRRRHESVHLEHVHDVLPRCGHRQVVRRDRPLPGLLPPAVVVLAADLRHLRHLLDVDESDRARLACHARLRGFQHLRPRGARGRLHRLRGRLHDPRGPPYLGPLPGGRQGGAGTGARAAVAGDAARTEPLRRARADYGPRAAGRDLGFLWALGEDGGGG
mmetsp:Transcript_90014/g.251662  ORF Transcript_90014/g.251662 Transcript_90014/m.251662 type:complete len:284 (+) Transcript_90014:718-1569(+)